jgi:hypothetical protein
MNRTASTTLSIVAAVALVACSNSPSEADARKAVENEFGIGSCSYFSLENFERVNGIKQDDKNYQVMVKYTFKVKPIPGISEKIASAEASMEKLLEYKKVLREVESNFRSTSTQEEIEKMNESLRRFGTFQLPPNDHFAFRKEEDRIDIEKAKLTDKSDPAIVYLEACPDLGLPRAGGVRQVFYLVAPSYSKDSGKNNPIPELLAKGVTTDGALTINFIKTEKGWVPTSFE